ncbi:MAG: 30S ribosomal protein S8 [Nitrospinota bacterium]
MSMTDPIADLLTRIRNALMVRKTQVRIPGSKLKQAIVDILQREGYILGSRWIEDDKQGILELDLRPVGSKGPVPRVLKRVSKPGRRIYVAHDDIGKVASGLGIYILSTSKGVLTDRDARSLRVGGEVLCEIE